LPHERTRELLIEDDIPRDLRLESVYHLDLRSLDRIRSDGRQIWKEVFIPLVEFHEEEDVANTFIASTVILRPEHWPLLLDIATRPQTTALDVIGKYVKRFREKNPNQPVGALIIETTAVFERILAYMHTGSSRMLTSRLMEELYVLLNIRQNGYPMLSNIIVVKEKVIDIKTLKWPRDAAGNGEVLLPSFKAASLSYSQRLALVSFQILEFQSPSALLPVYRLAR